MIQEELIVCIFFDSFYTKHIILADLGFMRLEAYMTSRGCGGGKFFKK